jgi:hypothetical protein
MLKCRGVSPHGLLETAFGGLFSAFTVIPSEAEESVFARFGLEPISPLRLEQVAGEAGLIRLGLGRK